MYSESKFQERSEEESDSFQLRKSALKAGLSASILAPTYNEADNIESLFERLAPVVEQVVNEFGVPCELVFVDDNSPDGTVGRILECASRFPDIGIRTLIRRQKRGLGTAIVEGIRSNPGNIVVVLDADLSHPPELIPKMVRAILDGHSVVIGSRYAPGGLISDWPLSRRLMSVAAIIVARALFGLRTRDPISGFFAVRADQLDGIPITGQCYKVLLEILVKLGDDYALEIPYRFVNRYNGMSKLGTKEVVDYLRLLWNLALNGGP